METRLKNKYLKEIVPSLKEKLDLKNIMAVPRITKIVVNSGIGSISKSKEQIEAVSRDLGIICGLKPSVRNARVSVAAFSLRKGAPVGLKVTLRGNRMYHFLDRLISVVFPRLRDFRGISKNSFDKSGNYTFGIAEQTVFPEIDIAKVSRVFGFEITIVTTAKSKEAGIALLESLGFPFEK